VVEEGRLVALAATVSDSSDVHLTIEASTAPEVRGRVESALLGAATRGLDTGETVTVEVPEVESGVRDVVTAAGLAPIRTLDRYGLRFTAAPVG
jgi:hypothetical protein